MTKIWRQPKEAKRPTVNERDFDGCDLSEWDAWDVYAPAMKSKGKVGKKAPKKVVSQQPLDVARKAIERLVLEELDQLEESLARALESVELDGIDEDNLTVERLLGDDTNFSCNFSDSLNMVIQDRLEEENRRRIEAENQPKPKKVAKKRVTASKQTNPLVTMLLALERLSARDQDGIPVKVCFVGGTAGTPLRCQITDEDGDWVGAIAAVERTGKLLRVYFDNKGGIHEFSVSKFPPEWTATLACGHTYNL